MTTTTHDDPLSWLNQFDSGLLDLERVTRSNFITDQRPRCEEWCGEPEFGRLCGNYAQENSQYCGTHQPRPVCTGMTAGAGTLIKTPPRLCKNPAMKGYSRCFNHLEAEEKARYDCEQEELARAEAKKDARRAERKRKRDAATLEVRASYLAGRFEPVDPSQLGFHACGANTLVCDLCDDFSPNDGGSEWSLDHLRECSVTS